MAELNGAGFQKSFDSPVSVMCLRKLQYPSLLTVSFDSSTTSCAGRDSPSPTGPTDPASPFLSPSFSELPNALSQSVNPL